MGFQQGNLDKLCGVYSVINGVEACLEYHGKSLHKRNELFCRLCSTLDKEEGGIYRAMCLKGLTVRPLGRLLETAAQFVRDNHNAELNYIRYAKRDVATLGKFLEISRDYCTSGGRVILCTRKPLHWSVIERVTTKKIILRDSDGRKSYDRLECSLDRVTGAPHLRASESFFIKLD